MKMKIFQVYIVLFIFTVASVFGKLQGGVTRELSASVPGCDPGFVARDDYPPGTAPLGMIEQKPCIPFDDPLIQAYLANPSRMSYPYYDYRCDTNNCPCGCCRYHPYGARCDYDNLYLTLPVSIWNIGLFQVTQYDLHVTALLTLTRRHDSLSWLMDDAR